MKKNEMLEINSLAFFKLKNLTSIFYFKKKVLFLHCN